jgi:hypothetical protein
MKKNDRPTKVSKNPEKYMVARLVQAIPNYCNLQGRSDEAN